MEKEYLLKKWLSGELTEEESRQFEALDQYPQFKAIVDEASRFKASSFSSEAPYAVLKEKIDQRRSVSRRGFFYWSSRIAAVFVLGFALYFAFISNGSTSVETGIGEKNRIELPDASLVILNASSHLEYSEKTWKDKREITLEGEAFFDVTKGNTFQVLTPEGSITVLGTEFNVKQRGTQLEVTCFEGSVRVASATFSEVLKAGDKIRVSEGNLSFLHTSGEGPSWTNNLSDFDEVPFQEVLEELERQYKITIECEDKSALKAIFTGGFTHDQLENAIRSVAEPMNLTYRIKDNTTVILYPRD